MPKQRSTRSDPSCSTGRKQMPEPAVDQPKQTLRGYLASCFGSKMFGFTAIEIPLRKTNFTFEQSPSQDAKDAWEKTKARWELKSNRVLGHIHRLTRSGHPKLESHAVVIQSEMDFGITMLGHYLDVLDRCEKSVRKIAEKVLGLQFDQTTMFWTVAPYIYARLRVNGLDERTAIEQIINWAGTPSDKSVNADNCERILTDTPGRMILSGFEGYGFPTFYLDVRNPDGLTHKVADKIAEYIVDNSELFASGSKDK